MKRRIALVLSLLLIVSLFPFSASYAGTHTTTSVTVNGQKRDLYSDEFWTRNKELQVKVKGFKKTDKGKDFGNVSVICGGREIMAGKTKDDGKGMCVYYFDNAGWPEAIFFYPKDGSNRRILLMNVEHITIVSPAYIGKWTGTVIPKEDGEEFPVTAEIDAAGNGQFKYRRSEDNMGKLPFLGQLIDGKLNATVANGVMQIKGLKGNLGISGSRLKGKVTVTFSNGKKEAFSVRLDRIGGDEDDDEDLNDEEEEDLGVVYE